MFKHILIVESLDSILLGLTTALQNNFAAQIDTALNGDAGIEKIKKAVHENGYDLIITGLDYANPETVESGEAFIDAARAVLPGVKAMVYSNDTRPYRIHKLFHNHKVNAFVAHSPDSMPQVIDALKMISKSEVIFVSPRYLPFHENNLGIELSDFDIRLLRHLSAGKSQPEISRIFTDEGIAHASVSTIEKRINKLRYQLDAKNTIHLITIAKEAGVI
ncbi:hypothetical protein AM493_00260 [Flavobacterium akiainvivens]|uniref:Uncharacterized protein n=1 Tax=Flavobacterium akiainvivens TaxID=1202724 RepID=A0A0M8M8D6_9FLAO|nr:response regulator transcription factor [Flavobacterium akiainvivens]KOS04645.1 hypothetical protein AM493_00260 [Flavobacterium akiainvivens]SFQ65477.1 DNA-binding response regulator, NarL/FixJ family, contains REC and HTH domains [Flavobacterium akiainvivens]